MQVNLIESGFNYKTINISSLKDALDIAVSNVDRDNYPDYPGTLFVEVGVYCEETEESNYTTIVLPPKEPSCRLNSDHDWQSPHAIVGGLPENPGVWGHGAGVLIKECCINCGCQRITNTWDYDPNTGIQGYETITYNPEYYLDLLEGE